MGFEKILARDSSSGLSLADSRADGGGLGRVRTVISGPGVGFRRIS